MAGKKTGLGRGLDALFPEKKENNKEQSAVTGKGKVEKTEKTENVSRETNVGIMVKISKVEPNRSQPRKKFSEDSLQELAESINVEYCSQFWCQNKKGIMKSLLEKDAGEPQNLQA